MQPFWHLVRRVIAQEGGNLCVISVRLETFAKRAKVTQPEARNPTEKKREEQLVPAREVLSEASTPAPRARSSGPNMQSEVMPC